MSMNPNDYWNCRKCGLRSYCTMFLICESCGHCEPDDVEYRKKKGWHRDG